MCRSVLKNVLQACLHKYFSEQIGIWGMPGAPCFHEHENKRRTWLNDYSDK